MHKKVISILIVFILIGSLSDCGKYDAPISSKTYDIKSFRIEDGKKIPIDPIFSKTVFEYEKEPEDKIDFVEWKPKPLTATGELEISWVKNNYFDCSDNEILRKNYEYFINFDRYHCESKIDGWQIDMFDNETLLLDAFSGGTRQAYDYGDYDSINGISIDLNLYDKVFRCRDRTTKEIFSISDYCKEDGIPLLFPNQLFFHNGQQDVMSERSFSDFRKYWSLKYKPNKQNEDKSYIVEKTQDILWFILTYYSSNKDKNMIIGYDLNKEVAFEFIVSDIMDIFTNQDSLFIIMNNHKVFKLDVESLEFSLFFDLSNFVEKKVENGYYHTFTFYDLAMIQYKNNKVLLNLRTKKIFQTDLLLGIINNNIYLYDENNNNIWGINQNTFEKTWHINTSDYSKYNKVILVDERGVLIQDKDMLYAFRPKK